MLRRPDLVRRSLGAVFGLAWMGLAIAGPGPTQALPIASHEADLAIVQRLLETPEKELDLAKAQVTIDQLIDPSIDAAATLAQLDSMASQLKAILPPVASKRLTLDALRYHIYVASPLNGYKPFMYDFDDPFGTNVSNKLISTYLSTRKGNCVSMPMLLIILGQKLGVDLTAATAPMHVFVKYRDDEGKYYNLEATSGAGFARDVWINQQFPMTPEALKSGIYMRPLTKKETVVLMVETLLQSYKQRQLHELRFPMAALALRYSPKNVSLILQQYGAYQWYRNLVINRYPTPDDMSREDRESVSKLENGLRVLYENAYALGWRPISEDEETEYNKRVLRAKQSQKGE